MISFQEPESSTYLTLEEAKPTTPHHPQPVSLPPSLPHPPLSLSLVPEGGHIRVRGLVQIHVHHHVHHHPLRRVQSVPEVHEQSGVFDVVHVVLGGVGDLEGPVGVDGLGVPPVDRLVSPEKIDSIVIYNRIG
jgi:hypothetical protein